jgi:hypothetical protein
MADAKTDKASPVQGDLLTKFLTDLEQLPKAIVDGMIKQAANEDHKTIIRQLGVTLNNQFPELASFIRDQSTRLSPQQRLESEQVLRISSAATLAPSVAIFSQDMGGPAATDAKIGIADIVTEIKKLIRILLGAFGISLPSWLDGIFLLIDELIHDLLSVGALTTLFSEGQTINLRDILSNNEQNHLKELTQLARLQREHALKPGD